MQVQDHLRTLTDLRSARAASGERHRPPRVVCHLSASDSVSFGRNPRLVHANYSAILVIILDPPANILVYWCCSAVPLREAGLSRGKNPCPDNTQFFHTVLFTSILQPSITWQDSDSQTHVELTGNQRTELGFRGRDVLRILWTLGPRYERSISGIATNGTRFATNVLTSASLLVTKRLTSSKQYRLSQRLRTLDIFGPKQRWYMLHLAPWNRVNTTRLLDHPQVGSRRLLLER